MVEIVLLLILSAIISMSETALVSTFITKVEMFKKKKFYKILKKLKEKEDEVLISILIANNLVNILIGILVAKYIYLLTGHLNYALASGIATFLIVTFGEVLPKNIALIKKEKVLYILSPFIYFLYLIFKPFSFIYSRITRLFAKKTEGIREEEIKMIIELAKKYGGILELEEKMIKRILELDRRRVREIYRHKGDVVMISASESIKTALEIMNKTKYSKLIVYLGDKDNIVGYIHMKDVIENLNKDLKVKDITRKILFVPEYMKILDLLKLFKETKQQIAAVVDEYGNFQGIVTLTDILEEIVGEMEDVVEKREEGIIVKESEIIVDGDIPIKDLNEKLKIDLPVSEEYNTIAGLIIYMLGRIPKVGEKIKVKKYTLEVLDADEKTIKKVKIKLI